MAERRMFAKTIVLSDAFLDMPLSARCLYFTLGMLADDDGFVNSPKSIMRQCGACEDDIKILLAKKFILSFESGVIVIKHWRINNYLRNDRYTETKCTEEKKQLEIKKNGSYTIGIPCGIPCGIPSIGIPSIGKDSIDKVSIDKVSIDKCRIDKDSIVDVVVEEPEIVEETTTTTTTTPILDEKQKLYGPYGNVCLYERQYNLLLGTCASQKLLDELIEAFSEKIEEGKEERYKADLPNAHYIRLLKYLKQRRMYPDKFRSATESKSRAAEATDKWYEEMKGRINGT